jgi:hypothetical protein
MYQKKDKAHQLAYIQTHKIQSQLSIIWHLFLSERDSTDISHLSKHLDNQLLKPNYVDCDIF